MFVFSNWHLIYIIIFMKLFILCVWNVMFFTEHRKCTIRQKFSIVLSFIYIYIEHDYKERKKETFAYSTETKGVHWFLIMIDYNSVVRKFRYTMHTRRYDTRYRNSTQNWAEKKTRHQYRAITFICIRACVQ